VIVEQGSEAKRVGGIQMLELQVAVTVMNPTDEMLCKVTLRANRQAKTQGISGWCWIVHSTVYTGNHSFWFSVVIAGLPIAATVAR
jgi:hypothetical protein